MEYICLTFIRNALFYTQKIVLLGDCMSNLNCIHILLEIKLKDVDQHMFINLTFMIVKMCFRFRARNKFQHGVCV